jgi:hypothetical protein
MIGWERYFCLMWGRAIQCSNGLQYTPITRLKLGVMIDIEGRLSISSEAVRHEQEISYAGYKLDFAERDECEPVFLRLSLAGNLEKPLMSLYGTEWRVHSAYRGSSHRRKRTAWHKFDMVWLSLSCPVWRRGVFYLFIRRLPAFAAPRGRRGGSQHPVI